MGNKNKLRKKYIYPRQKIWNGLEHEYYTITNIPVNLAFLIKPYKYINNRPSYSYQSAHSNYHYTNSFAAIFKNIYLDFCSTSFIIFPEPKDILIQQHFINPPYTNIP